jgi:LAO/AO transport system kinase
MEKKKKKQRSALSVSGGVPPPEQVNNDAIARFKKKKRVNLDAESYYHGILDGNRTILSKAITLIESSLPEHNALAQKIISLCLPHSGKSIRIGITGIPGVGKSTFIESFGSFLTENERKLAVLAIDPSSERSKGSILGDKTRMEKLSADPKAFIRPSPSGGSLGGVARKTRESIILCEAAGFDTIFIETVGVGQSETAVHSMVDFFLLLMLPGAGDELQGIKRGIMEMADLIVINKADGQNVERAKLAKTEFQNALHLFPAPESGWIPKVLTCSALKNSGIDTIWEEIVYYRKLTLENEFFRKKRNKQSLYWMYETINEKLKQSFYEKPGMADALKSYEQKVLKDELNSFQAALELLKKNL